MRITSKRITKIRATALLLLATVGAGPALAQETTETKRAAKDEIVVTARKVEESIQDVPVSITAFTQDYISERGLADIGDIAIRTPGLRYGDFGDEKLSPISLRGVIGSAGSAGADPAVGVYLDEVYLGQGAAASVDLFDLERVEVLRGPQGTLFGRNTVGGVIHYRTAAPTDEFEATVEAGYGKYDKRRVGGSVSGPVAEGVSLRLSGVYDARDGYFDNVVLDRDVNTENSYAVRAQALFDLGADSSLRITGDYRRVDQEPLVFETLNYNEARLLPQLLDLFAVERNTDPYDYRVYADDITEETLDLWGVAGTYNVALDGIDVTAVVSYRSHDYFSRTDTDRSALSIIYDGDPEQVDRFSAEVRATGALGPVDWLAGFYYFDQNTKNQSFVEIGSDLADLLGDPSLNGLNIGSDADLDTRSVSGFGSLTWEMTDKFELSVGGRYTHERKDIDYSQSDPVFLLGGDFAVVASDKWGEFTPNATARYRFTPNVMAYVAVSKGFKSGGFNDALGDADGISFDPESLWNYEAGLRTQTEDGRYTANLTVFTMDWKDIQITTDNPATPIFDPITANAGAARSTGVEVELVGRPTDALTISVNAAYTDAKYKEGAIPAPGGGVTALDRLPFAPEFTTAFAADYETPITSSLAGFVGVEVIGQGETFLTLDNQPDGRVGAYALVNLRIGVTGGDGRWRATLWGRNLTDKTVAQRLFDLSDQDVIGQKFIVLNDPVTFGGDIRVSF